MSKKKDSYMELLKKVVAEYDAGVLDIKGPMLEPIVNYRGDGEMETNKDAASILERYYYREQMETPINTVPEEQKNEIVTGETPDAVGTTAGDMKQDIVEQEVTQDEKDEGGTEAKPSDETGQAAVNDLEKELTTAESAILEKLIAEMEEVSEEDEPVTEQAEENPVPTPTRDDNPQAGTDSASEDEVDRLIEQIEAELAKEDEGEDEGGEEGAVAPEPEEGAEGAEDEGDEDEDLDIEEQAFLKELDDELAKAEEEGGEEAPAPEVPAEAPAPEEAPIEEPAAEVPAEGEGEGEEELDIDKELEEQLIGGGNAVPKDEEDLDEELSEAFRIFREQVEEEPESEVEEEEEPTPAKESKVIV